MSLLTTDFSLFEQGLILIFAYTKAKCETDEIITNKIL